MKRVALPVALTVTASLILTTPVFGTARPAASARAGSTLQWGACPRSYPDLQGTPVKCAALKVPLNYADPGGKTITLEVSLLPHTSSQAAYRGYILTNPGGPGGPGLDLPLFLAGAVPHHVGDDYDWIGWDPRGVGASRPALHCINDYSRGPRQPYVPATQRILHYWLARSKRYAAACERRHPALLNHMTTKDNARDMNAIREALGVNRISYYGFSYGTYLGQVFATLYPHHLDRLVLDSNVDPRRVWYAANLDQDVAFDRNINIYFRWVAKYRSQYHLGRTGDAVSRHYYALQNRLAQHPKGQLGGDEFNDVVLYAGYFNQLWLQITGAWRRLEHGNAKPMTHLYRQLDTPTNDNSYAVYLAVQCTDTAWPGLQRNLKDNWRVYRSAPFETWGNAWFNAPCIYWHAKPHRPVTINGSKVKSALLIDETNDAATPFPGSLEVRRLFPHSSLIAEPGGTNHADSLSGDACVDDWVARYLQTGDRPPRQHWNGPDYLCRPLPKPVPKGAGNRDRQQIPRFRPVVRAG